MEAFPEEPHGIVVTDLTSEPNHMKIVVPSQHTNGHQLSMPPVSHRRSASPKGANRKPAFNRDFKQAVFQKRGREDGSSNIHVTFTSNGAKAAIKAVKTMRELQENRPFVRPAAVTVNKPIKPKPTPTTYKDIVTIDKKKMQEEIESIPKPDHLVDAEKALLSFEGFKTFTLGLGDKEYGCVGCQDIFPSQFALDDHLNRQSYQLFLDCPPCARKITFTNKCHMYKHLLCEHDIDREQSNQIALMYANLQVLPRSQIKFTGTTATTNTNTSGSEADELPSVVKMEATDVLEDLVPAEDNRGMEANSADEISKKEEKEIEIERLEENGTHNIKEQLQEPAVDIKPIIINGADDADADSDDADTAISCTECSKMFETEWTLQTHFSLPNEDHFQPEVCIPCRVELVTPCARKAHMRVHGLTEPFVCPECGQAMPKKNVFLKHIRLHCLHYSKLSEFTCPSCSETFNSAEEQLAHLKINSSHLRFEGERSYYKCNGCPKAFKSVAAHSKHESCPGAGCTVVHMCNNCPQQTVFRSWAELTEHRAQAHPDLSWKPKRSKMFGCYLCVHKSKSKQGLLDHLMKTHGKKKIDYMCQYCGVELDCRQSLYAHREVCPFKDTARGTIKPPLAMVERVPKLSSSSSVVSDNSTNTNTLAENAEETAPVSSVSSTTPSSTAAAAAAASTTSQQKHQNISYLAHTPSFNCHICTAEFTGYNKLRDHVTRRHEGRGLIYECWLCRDRGNTANFYRQAALDKHMIDTHKIQISSPSIDSPEEGTANGGGSSDTEEPPTKRMRIWTQEDQAYQCCRCDFSAHSVEDFKDHIKRHKTSSDSHQCSECGMCFTVQLALKRHLFAVHKVSDYAKYSRSQYMAEYERQLNDTQGKCPVCQKQFEDELQLRKHLRTHGMMYINTRRVVHS